MSTVKLPVLAIAVIVVMFLTCISPSSAQIVFQRTFGGGDPDAGYSVQQTSDGGYIITGETVPGDFVGAVYLIKADSLGNTLWIRTYYGSWWTGGRSVRQTSDSGYIIAGYTTYGPYTNSDVYLIKTNSLGDTLWTRTYGGASDDGGSSAQQTFDGGYIIAGYTNSFDAGYYDAYLIKTNSLGDTLWTRYYYNITNQGYSVQQTSDSGYIIAGGTSIFGAGNGDAYLIKTNSLGDTLWTQTYGGPFTDYGYSAKQTSDGGYIITGSTPGVGGNWDVWLIKTNSLGDTLWTRTYGGASDDYGYSVQQTYDGGYIVTGYTQSFGAGGADVYLIKTDSLGGTLWTRTFGAYGGVDDDYGYSVQQTSDSGYVIAGYTTSSFGAGSSDVYLIKTDRNGNIPGFSVNNRWNMISVPLTVSDYRKTILFPTAGSPAYAYDGGYIQKDTLVNGTGYWLKFIGVQTIPMNGVTRSLDSIAVKKGWNMIGSISTPVAVAQITSVPGGIVSSQFYGYKNGYVKSDSIQPGKAYWMKADQNGKLILASSSSNPSTRIQIVPTEELPPAAPGEKQTASVIPAMYALNQNYPNPFNPTTTISYALPKGTFVTLKVFNMLGEEVATIVNEVQSAGYKTVEWDAASFSSGVYMYRLTAGQFTEVKKLLIIR